MFRDPGNTPSSAEINARNAVSSLRRRGLFLAVGIRPQPEPDIGDGAGDEREPEQIAAAAANCKIPLPTQRSLQAMWQIRVNCTRVDSFGTRFDTSFADDQNFDPGPLK